MRNPSLRLARKRRRRAAPGTAPGTLVADPEAPRPVIRLIGYGPDASEETTIGDPGEIDGFRKKWPIVWLNVDGLGDAETVRRIGEMFGLHRLALEDVLNVHQRSKVEQYDDHLFVVARMVMAGDVLTSEQISLFFGHNFVITFQEDIKGDCLDPVRTRIRTGAGRIRRAGADYLAYSILDSITDNYFPALEDYGERLELIEHEVINQPGEQTLSRIYSVKRQLLLLRRCIWPHREALNALYRDETVLISSETRIYLRDCFDHAVQLLELLETHREIASSLMDVYLSSVSNRMNEIMKVLTIFSAIFIPMTFIAGVYGMNFNPAASHLNMPELNWYWGYPFALFLMASVPVGMLIYFWRAGWIGPGSKGKASAALDTARAERIGP